MENRVTAIVLAAGQGKRMKSNIQKQFMLLQDKPVLYYSLACFQMNDLIDQIILVTGKTEIEYCRKEIVEHYNFTKVIDVVEGGAERYHSVQNGLDRITGEYENGIVLIHDGARPFVDDRMIQESIESATEYGACTVAVPVKDTIKVVDEDGFGIETPNRNMLWQIQTPQTFMVRIIKDAHDGMRRDQNTNITDDTMLVEKYCNTRVKMVSGAYENIKITTPEDMILANAFMNTRS